MKSLALSAVVLGLNAIMCHAAPSPVQPKARQVTVNLDLEFCGAGSNPPCYDIGITIPPDMYFESFNISNPLSVSTISLSGPGYCSVTGIDGSEVLVQGGESVDVGPPQTQVSGSCSEY